MASTNSVREAPDPGPGPGPFAPDVDLGRLAGWSIAGIGCLLVVLTLAHWYWFDAAAFDALVVTLPGFATVGLWYVVQRGQLRRDLYPRVLKWTLATGGALAVFLVAVFLIQGSLSASSVPLLLFISGIGSTTGVLIGSNRAQNALAQRQARSLRAERERLVFLNHLLRHNVINRAAIIKGKAEIAAEEADAAADHLATIEQQSDDVVELIENIRVLVDAATTDRDLHPVDLSTALNRETEAIRQSDAAVRVETDIPDGIGVLADELLRYVFENLLHNAVEHHDRATPQVTVTASHAGEDVVVTVADDGPGITDHEKEGVFEPEMHGDHGVGLYLVDTLVTRYGGDVTIDDNEPRGTVVTVRLQAAG